MARERFKETREKARNKANTSFQSNLSKKNKKDK